MCDTHNCVLKISNAVNGRRWWRLHCRCIYRCHLAIRNSNCMHMYVCVCATIKRFHLYYLIKIQYRSNSEFISIDKNNNKKTSFPTKKANETHSLSMRWCVVVRPSHWETSKCAFKFCLNKNKFNINLFHIYFLHNFIHSHMFVWVIDQNVWGKIVLFIFH